MPAQPGAAHYPQTPDTQKFRFSFNLRKPTDIFVGKSHYQFSDHLEIYPEFPGYFTGQGVSPHAQSSLQRPCGILRAGMDNAAVGFGNTERQLRFLLQKNY
jgi:hypothetical protein